MNVAGRENTAKSIVESKPQPLGGNATTSNVRFSLLALVLFSVFYFSYTILLASGRYLTVDEISTVIVASSPSLKTIWDSPRHVLDFQTATFYILARVSRALFGHGLVATRLPSILGMYTFCICLFFFAWRRVGVLGATAAMVFPVITGAFPYACEARPYGPAMGCIGLALLFWQLSEDRMGRKWLWAFSVSLLGALALHPFAVCCVVVFLIPQLLSFVVQRRIRWATIAATVIPVAIAACTYLPVAAGFRKFAVEVQAEQGLIGLDNIEGAVDLAYASLFGPSLAILAICFGAICLSRFDEHLRLKRSALTRNDLVIAIGLLLAPIAACVLALFERSIFFPRYISWAVAGTSLLLAFGIGTFTRCNYAGIVITTILVLTAARGLSTPLHKRLQGETWNPYALNTPALYVQAGNPLAVHELLARNLPDAPVLCTSLKEFVFIEYNSAALRSRIRYVYSRQPNYGAAYITSFRSYYTTPFTAPLTVAQAASEFHSMFLYGPMDTSTTDLLQLLQSGARIASYQTSSDGTHFLARLYTAP